MKNCRYIYAIFILTAIMSGCSCSDESDTPSTTAYRYEHIDGFSAQYAEKILSFSNSEMELQECVLDLMWRYSRLNAAGDSLLAEYMITSVDEILKAKNQALADSIGLDTRKRHPGR